MNFGLIAAMMGLGMVAVGLYSFFRIRRLLRFYFRKKGRVLDVASALAAVVMMVCCRSMWRFSAVFVLHILGAFLAVDVMAAIVKAVWKRAGGAATSAYRICGRVYQCGVIPLILAAALLGYGFYNMRHFVSTEYTVPAKKLHSDYHIVLITDTHYDTIQDTALLKAAAEEISSLGADLVILGGDIVEEGTSRESMQEVFRVLGGIRSTYGTYYVYGNHDLQPYTENKQYTQAELEEAAAQGGVTVLCDTYIEIGDDFILAGRGDAAWGGTSGRASTKDLLEGADRQKYIVMVDHQPTGVGENEEQGVDLMLSGHTHAGQMWPAGTVLSMAGRYNYGRYGYNDMTLIVSSGFTGWGYPLRTQEHCEYVQVFLEASGT